MGLTVGLLQHSAPSIYLCAQWPGPWSEKCAQGADVPGGEVLLLQIEQCEKILMYEGRWWRTALDNRPEHELDLSLVASLAVQSELLACHSRDLRHFHFTRKEHLAC